MIKRTRTILIIAIVFACASLCSACQPYQYYGKHPELYSVFGSAVPGSATFNSFVGKIKTVETDSSGRVLFSYYESMCYYSQNEYNSTVYGYAICQHYDGERSYYLRDICFEIDNSFENITEERIERLKQRNNWDQPLDLDAEGMASTGIFDSFRYPAMVYEGMITWEQYIKCSQQGREKLPQMLKDYMPEYFDGKRIYAHCYEIFSDGRAFYIVKAGERSCIVATNSDGSIYEGSPLWIDNPFSEEYIEQLVKFRAEFEAATAAD